ncbi:hypothetical protein TIFTF001_008799 [Ficus carica]|uniref:Uncharacterized protein n=1 Tax=Ficus carica TaxID=3494 RepID=A0AA88A9C9_FICCA|nr:hypothetical protein TIFTF001_008799 [Ficus carica]
MMVEATAGWHEHRQCTWSSCASDRTIKSGAGNQIGRLLSCLFEATCEALTITRLGNEYRQYGGGSCGDPPWKRNRSYEIVRLEHRPLLPRISGRDLCRHQLPPPRSPPRRRRGANLVASFRHRHGNSVARERKRERGEVFGKRQKLSRKKERGGEVFGKNKN